jgi:hypothetical protein
VRTRVDTRQYLADRIALVEAWNDDREFHWCEIRRFNQPFVALTSAQMVKEHNVFSSDALQLGKDFPRISFDVWNLVC